MPLQEVLVLKVGSVIAKAVLKLWLKDKSFASDITTGLVDIIASVTPDVLARQRGERQLAEIGQSVADSLTPLFEREGAALDEGEQMAVALAAAETLDQTPLDPSLLVKRNLDPALLAKHLLDSRLDATQGLSADGASLYRRMISEICERVDDLATQQPTFAERGLAELLEREDEIRDVVRRILAEVQQAREIGERENPQADGARFEQDYRLAVGRALDRLELLGVELSTASQRYSLSVAYVTLSVRATPEAEEDEGAATTISAEELLAGPRRLLIRGMAGSGKTTLLKWIAVQSASQGFTGALSEWNNTVPFFIRLRQCSGPDLPRPEELPGLVAPAKAGTMPDQWVHGQLESGRAIVLVDGLDEVREARREEVRSWIDDILVGYPDARVIVTTRHHAAEVGWLQKGGFAEAELQPMQLGDIERFIDHWHAAVREGLREPSEKGELTDLAENMKRSTRDKRPLRNLAESPLLCAMLCALHRDRRAQLPEDRILLYDACCEMLMERREIERQIDLSDYPQLSYRDKRSLLESFAYWMLANGWSEVSREEAAGHFSHRLENMPRVPAETTGEEVCRYFVERSGIIREPVQDEIDFAHRTFQEYLAARAAVAEGNIGVLLKNATDDQWREVIVLAAGMTDEKSREKFIGDLIGTPKVGPSVRVQLQLMAVACLETSVTLSAGLRTKVQDRLAALVPPKSVRDAKALAAAGELAVQFLQPDRSHRAEEASLCVRTLALIGAQAAFEVMRGYAGDTRKAVVNEVAGALSQFARMEFWASSPHRERSIQQCLAQCLGFTLPGSGADQYGNPVMARDGRQVDPDTGYAYEVWLDQPPMEFVLVPPGAFMMGECSERHPVRLTRPFYLAKYQLTQGQWQTVMGTTPWSGKHYVREDGRNPAVYISWGDCQEAIEKLGSGFRLPTEAEWEYACRAGSSNEFCFGDDEPALREHGWYVENALKAGEEYAHGVGHKRPNAWGLYDMAGNVFEWCHDWYGEYPSGMQTDPSGPERGFGRVMRGGCFLDAAGCCRSAYRHGFDPGYRYGGVGLRPAKSLP